MTRAVASFCVVWALSGCNVASVAQQPSAIPQNRCASDSDCAIGSCDSNYCRALTGTFDTILFEVSPPADGTSIEGVQFLKPVRDVLSTDGGLDLGLALVAQVSGEVTVGARKCTPKFVDADGKVRATANDSSIPALITVIPSEAALGLFSSPAAAQAAIPNGSSWNFHLNVPAGLYDIYVQPDGQPDVDCVVPPQLLRRQMISGTVNLDIALPEPQTFELDVTWPLADGALDGWTVDMLDPIVGRAISNRAPLVARAGGTEYVANFAYLPVVGDTIPVDQFVRLSPPDDPAAPPAPTVLFARSGLTLFSANKGTVKLFTVLPVPVHIAGTVTAGVSPDPVAATVTLVATKVTGIAPGIVPSFVRTVTVKADGAFDLDVLPGEYRVSAVPSGSAPPSGATYAAATVEWQVGTTPSIQAGRVIELSDSLPINGRAVDPSGTSDMTGALVQATASPASIVTDLLHQALGEAPYVPRGASTTIQVDDNGSFALKVDSGIYDFSVRPRASSGFAWLVIPGLPVGTTTATSAGPSLNTLSLPLPVAYRGKLTVPGLTADAPTAVPGASIDAYIYMKGREYTADPAQADSVLQIAETRSDENGSFSLMIPAALNAAPN